VELVYLYMHLIGYMVASGWLLHSTWCLYFIFYCSSEYYVCIPGV